MPGLRHAKTSAAGASSDPAKVGGNDWNEAHKLDDSGVDLSIDTTSGGKFPLQPHIGRKRFVAFVPLANSNSVTGAVLGLAAPAAIGTGTARALANTNLFTMGKRYGNVSAATANSRAGIYFNQEQVWRGNVPGLGGFRFTARFGVSDAAPVATGNLFAGLSSSTTILSGGSEPGAITNVVGVGCDSTDSTLSIYSNDSSNPITKTPLGAAFPSNTQNTDVYEVMLFAAAADTKISYRVTRLNTGDVAEGSVASDLPLNTTGIFPIIARGNMGTAAAVGIDIFGMTLETDF